MFSVGAGSASWGELEWPAGRLEVCWWKTCGPLVCNAIVLGGPYGPNSLALQTGCRFVLSRPVTLPDRPAVHSVRDQPTDPPPAGKCEKGDHP